MKLNTIYGNKIVVILIEKKKLEVDVKRFENLNNSITH